MTLKKLKAFAFPINEITTIPLLYSKNNLVKLIINKNKYDPKRNLFVTYSIFSLCLKVFIKT